MSKIIIPQNGFTEKDVTDTSSTGFIGWERLTRIINRDELTSDEILVGIEVTVKGVIFKVKYK